MPNWCHNTLTVSGDEAALKTFVEAALGRSPDDGVVTQPLSFNAIVPQPSDEELRELETYKPCSMCGAYGTLPDSEEQAINRGARWFPWMEPAERESRTCNVCHGSKEELVGMEGWYVWRVQNWGTKWDASFDGPFIAFGDEGMDVDVSVEAQGDTITPTVAVYKFDTAWAPPTAFTNKASELHPDLEFVLRYGEPGEGYAGEEKFVGGVMIDSEELAVEDVLAPEEMWF